MGYQLWTSPVTGIRRTGTRLRDLTLALETSILARTISEPLYSCPADAPAEEMRQLLEQRGFDAAGVQTSEDATANDFVLRSELTNGQVKDHKNPICAENLISDGAPLSEILTIFEHREWIFVLSGAKVSGIITRADLNKPLVRVYLFGVISLLEMHMRFWIQKEYGNEGWEVALNASRLALAQRLYDQRRTHQEDISLLHCVQFCDLGALFVSSNELRNKLDITSRRETEHTIKRAQQLRDRLAHSQDDLAEGSSWLEILPIVSAVEDLLARSDRAVELDAAAQAGHFQES